MLPEDVENFPERRNFQEPIEKNYKDGTTWKADPVKVNVKDNEKNVPYLLTMIENRKTSSPDVSYLLPAYEADLKRLSK